MGFEKISSLLLIIGFVAIAITRLPTCEGARILCASHQFGSHLLMVHTVAEGLVERGHEVYTIFSDRMPVPKGLKEKGFKILTYHTPEGSTIMADPGHARDLISDLLNSAPQNMDEESLWALKECTDMDNDISLNNKIKDLHFDLLILDIFPLSSCLQFLVLKYDIPFVLVPPNVDMEMTRAPVLPSFVPCPLLEITDKMTFRERLQNTIMTIMMSVPALSPFTAVKDVTLVTKYSKDPDVTSWRDISRKAELFLVSRGPILEYPYPLPPNVINIECLTCKAAKPLEKSIEDMVANAKGIIVVSFGSLITELPDNVAEKFLKAFAMRDEIVFWRYKGKLPGNVPPNVNVMKWLPQNDLLAHPKTVLFVTHSGNNGQYESVYHGVPMLAFPLFAEQPHNAHRIVGHGFGLKIDIRTFTTEEFVDKMAQIINNPSFRAKTQKAGEILKSYHMDARQTSVYWIEHVLEFGAEHLRSHALKMSWLSFYMIDILLLADLIGFISLGVLICAICKVKKFFTPPKSKKKKN